MHSYIGTPVRIIDIQYQYRRWVAVEPSEPFEAIRWPTVLRVALQYSTRLGASSEQVVRDVNPQLGFRVFDKPTSES